jgi:polysaccharide biosynthesis transport protein
LRSAQITLHQIVTVLKRRKRFLIVPPVVVTLICVVGALYLPRRYESSTTIMVQKDEILNPLVSFTMAVQMASEDRLRTFEEIVYSRNTIEMLLDSLGMRTGTETSTAWDELVDKTKASIRTDKSGSDSFTMRFVDSDPVRAQRAVSTLARLFIRTRLQAEYQRNEYTVKFFEGKLREYEESFGQSQHTVLNLLRERAQKLPGGGSSLTARFDVVSEKIRETSDVIRDSRRALTNIGLFPAAFRTDRGRVALSELTHAEMPNSSELRSLVSAYDSVMIRYTPRHPDVARLESLISGMLERTRVVVQSQVDLLSGRLADLQRNRSEMIQAITQSSISEKVDQETEANYTFYQQLYNEMRVKLEQARIAQELGRNAEKGFVIIDPARVPTKPTKPNRILIVAGGFGVGLLLGIVAALMAELLDSTIRSPKEIEVYRKPIIGLLPEGARHA